MGKPIKITPALLTDIEAKAKDDRCLFPNVIVTALANQIRQLEAEVLSLEIREAVQVLEMLRDKTSDDGEPIDPAGQTALRWAAWIEKKEMQLAQMRANLQQKDGAE